MFPVRVTIRPPRALEGTRATSGHGPCAYNRGDDSAPGVRGRHDVAICARRQSGGSDSHGRGETRRPVLGKRNVVRWPGNLGDGDTKSRVRGAEPLPPPFAVCTAFVLLYSGA